VHHHTFQINPAARCSNSSSLLLGVYVYDQHPDDGRGDARNIL